MTEEYLTKVYLHVNTNNLGTNQTRLRLFNNMHFDKHLNKIRLRDNDCLETVALSFA